MSEEHTSAHEDHKEAHKSAMQALDAEPKGQSAAMNPQHGRASDAQAHQVEQQEEEIRGEIELVSAQHSAAYDDHKKVNRAALLSFNVRMRFPVQVVLWLGPFHACSNMPFFAPLIC